MRQSFLILLSAKTSNLAIIFEFYFHLLGVVNSYLFVLYKEYL